MTATECPKCSNSYSDHHLRYTGHFILVCDDPNLLPATLGSTYDIAVEALKDRCTPAVAAGLWAKFGPVDLGQRLLRIAEHNHTPGADCSNCPPGWPVRCRDHGGGCEGSIHATLWNRRSKKRYTQRSQLDPHDVRVAYENPKRGRYLRGSTPFEMRSVCDHCSSPASTGEIQIAVEGMVEMLGSRRDAAAS